MKIKKIILIVMFLTTISNIFGQTVIEIESFTEDSIPSWAHDARRMSIITIGSIPFTSLVTTLGYTVIRYAVNDFDDDYVPNPFPTSSTAANINKKEQIGILTTAISLGLAIGIADLIVVKVQENKEKKEIQREQSERVKITPMTSEGIEKE